MLSGLRPSSVSTVSMTLAVSDLLKPRLRSEIDTLIIGSGDNLRVGRPDAIDETHGRGIGEAAQRRCGLVGETRGGVFGVADGDLFKILDAPEIAVLTNRPKIEAGDAERLGADLRIPAIEAAEEDIRRAVRQPSRLDRIKVVDQKQENVPIGSVKCRCIAGDVHAGM